MTSDRDRDLEQIDRVNDLRSTQPIEHYRITCYGSGASYHPPRPAGLDPCAFDRTVYTHQDMIRALEAHGADCPWTALLATTVEIPRDP